MNEPFLYRYEERNESLLIYKEILYKINVNNTVCGLRRKYVYVNNILPVSATETIGTTGGRIV